MAKYSFKHDIHSVEYLQNPVVVLITGEMYEMVAGVPTLLCELDEIVKHVVKENGALYVATSESIFRVEGSKVERLKRTDLSKITAMCVSQCGSTVVVGDYDGKISVLEKDESYSYQEHEEMIIGLVVKNKTIFSASEDGVVVKTKIGAEEPTDVYEIPKILRYIGELFERITVIDTSGSCYVLDKKVNDFVQHRKVLGKVSEIFKVDKEVYIEGKENLAKIVTHTETEQLPVNAKRIDGLYREGKEIFPIRRNKITEWAEEKQPNELKEFFEDL